MNKERIMELLEQKKLMLLKAELLEERTPDIAEFLDELDPKTALMVFRMLPKETAVDVFAYLDSETQKHLPAGQRA